jgi:hypothetical protein
MIGRSIGHYRVVSALGAGAMGEVYRARDEKLDRDVALKVLPAGLLADGGARSRFRKEATALSRLSHPHVAMLLDFDSADGVDFLAMELVPGKTLAEELQGGPLPAKDVVRLGAQLARGLKAAHDQGVIHRDLKPGNLALTDDGLLKVLDFGVARLVAPRAEQPGEDTATHTAPGKAVGSPPYMSPEQFLGKDVDARTDLYSAAAVLYELATGRRPFGDHHGGELADAILHHPPVPPSAVNASVPPGLEAVILKSLEKDPALRHQTAGDLLADLDRLARDGASVGRRAARANGRITAATSWGTGVRAAAAATLTAIAGGAWVMWPSPPLRVHNIRPVTERLSAAPDPAWATDGARLYYSDRTNDGTHYWQVPLSGGEPTEIPFPHRYGAVVAYVHREAALLMLGNPVVPRGEQPLYLVTVPTWSVRRVGQLQAFAAAVSPDEHQVALAYGKDPRRLGLADMDGSNLRPLVELPVSAGSLAWAPDGQRLRFSAAGPPGREAETWVWETSVAGEPPRPLWPGHSGRWSGDGRTFVMTRGDVAFGYGLLYGRRFDLYAVRDKGWLRWPSPEPTQVTSGPIHFSSPGSLDGRTLYAIGDLPRGEIVRIESGSATPKPFLGGASAHYAEPSPDGSWVAWVTHPQAELWKSRADGSEKTRLTSAGTAAFLPRWSPDGRSLVFVAHVRSGLSTVVARISAEGGPLEALATSGPDVGYWDPCYLSGDRVAFSSFAPGLAQVELRAPGRVSPVPGAETLRFPKCSREGHVLAADIGASSPYRVRWAGRSDWEDIDLGNVVYPNWTRDGKAIVGLGLDPTRVVRFSLATRRSQTIAELGTMPLVVWVGVPWMGLAADDSPLVTLDRGTRGLYALELAEP